MRVKEPDLSTMCEQVLNSGESVSFEFGGHEFALISREDLEYFEKLDNERLNRLADEALKEPGENIPYEKIRKETGLES